MKVELSFQLKHTLNCSDPNTADSWAQLVSTAVHHLFVQSNPPVALLIAPPHILVDPVASHLI